MDLPNFKRLGIEKEMNQEINQLKKTDLDILIDSSYFQSPLITNRRDNAEYCEIEVIDCNTDFWYKNLIGFTFFCLIEFSNYGHGRFIKEFKGVKLTNNKMIIFRGFDPKDVIIL